MFNTPDTDLASALLAEGFVPAQEFFSKEGNTITWHFPENKDLLDFVDEYRTPNTEASKYATFAQKRRTLIRKINNR